ncbi:ribose ABC transporter permease [Georgenia halophila]|uniref:Ribose ABC transporter permease n=1 Tax=Georgenia halophila TaxID=620889 RepID=A0ABP8LFA5_9MICO
MTSLAVGRRRERVLPPPVTGQEAVLLGVIAVIWVLLGVFTPAFLSDNSIQPLLVRLAPIGVMAVGMTLVIISGGIDISVAASLMVCSVVTAKLLVSTGMPMLPALAISLALGGLLGAINGVLIAYGRVHAIIITFGTANLFLFLGLRIFDSQTVNNIPNTFSFLSRGEDGRTLGVPHSFLLMFAIVVVAWWYVRHVASGRHFFAIGGDQHSARLAGIPVERRIMSAYIITGVLVGLAACMTLAGGTSTLDQNVGSGQELAVIAAVVIGGTSIMGGRGSVLGSVLGALLVQTVRSGVTQMGWPTQLANLFVGLFIIIAVGADLMRQRRRAR